MSINTWYLAGVIANPTTVVRAPPQFCFPFNAATPMALRKCHECGKSVSTSAASCPSCGAPVKKPTTTISTGAGCVIVLFAMIAWVWYSGSSGERTQHTQIAAPGEVTTSMPSPDGHEMEQRAQAAKDKADAARRSLEAAATEREAKKRRQKDSRDSFVKKLNDLGIDRSQIDSVSIEGDFLMITVSNDWHRANYQIRLQIAQSLWGLWASIASPEQPDKARIKIVDYNKNVVGGSRALGGSLIWVQEK